MSDSVFNLHIQGVGGIKHDSEHGSLRDARQAVVSFRKDWQPTARAVEYVNTADGDRLASQRGLLKDFDKLKAIWSIRERKTG